MSQPIARLLSLAVFGALMVVPANAGSSLTGAGDGSGSDNPDLMRAQLPVTCTDCDPGPSYVGADDPFFDVNWSASLRGSYIQDSAYGDYYQASIAPQISLTHKASAARLTATGSAEIVRSTLEETRLASLRLAVAGDFRFDPTTQLGADAGVMLSRTAANTPGNSSATAASPQTLSAYGNLSLKKTFGAFEVTVRGNASRSLYGPTTLTNGTLSDNSWQNAITGGGGLRIGFNMSPILTVFTDLSASYSVYDAVSPTQLIKFDGPTYIGKGGIKATWSSLLSVEASVGMGVRQYTAGLGELRAVLYDANVVFTPDPSWTFNAGLSTTIAPPGSAGGNGKITYAVAGGARYKVNPWLALRTSASWSRTDGVGVATLDTNFGAGVGSDYAINENTTFTADYAFAHSEGTGSIPRNIHTWMLGVTFAK